MIEVSPWLVSAFGRQVITLNQLKNAGGMRLVRSKEVADSIAVYDLNYESLNSLYNTIYFNNGQTSNRHVERETITFSPPSVPKIS